MLRNHFIELLWRQGFGGDLQMFQDVLLFLISGLHPFFAPFFDVLVDAYAFAGFCILLLDPKIFPAISFAFYIAIIVLLISVFTIGKATHAALSWIEIGSFKLQPSEFAKLATSLCLSRYLDTFEVSFK